MRSSFLIAPFTSSMFLSSHNHDSSGFLRHFQALQHPEATFKFSTSFVYLAHPLPHTQLLSSDRPLNLSALTFQEVGSGTATMMQRISRSLEPSGSIIRRHDDRVRAYRLTFGVPAALGSLDTSRLSSIFVKPMMSVIVVLTALGKRSSTGELPSRNILELLSPQTKTLVHIGRRCCDIDEFGAAIVV